jgi:hypothetical protein
MSACSPAAKIFGEAILSEAPRVLGLMDREEISPTAGCCDRTYWAWKFVDFPGARFQEALCVLSFLYANKLNDSSYYGSDRLLDWIGHGMRFWSSIQHHDGSFDEAYPFERSLAATAFTTFYIGEALAFSGESLPGTIRERVRETMARAGIWLIHNDETHGFLSNHLAAAAAALYHVYRVTGDEKFERRSRYFLGKILDHQSQEGWYDEYGGADPGYQTHGSFYLARYWQLTGDKSLAESLGRSMSFLAHFIHPDGSVGGEYASRNTQTYYPAAFEMFAAHQQAAAWIAETMRPSVFSGAAAGLRCVDSYNYFPFLNNLVFAYLARVVTEQAKVKPEEPSGGPGLAWFPQAGIARVRRERYDAYVGTAKGSVIKVFDRSLRKLVYSDCGYVGRLVGGKLFSSQHQDQGWTVDIRPDRIEVEGEFCETSRPKIEPLTFVAFRLFSLSLGRIPAVACWLKRLLVKILIYRKKPLKIRFKRTIVFDDMNVSVCDELFGPDGARVETLQRAEIFTTIHMGSSRYFINNELEECVSNHNATHDVDPKQISSGVKLRHGVTFCRGASEPVASTFLNPGGEPPHL